MPPPPPRQLQRQPWRAQRPASRRPRDAETRASTTSSDCRSTPSRLAAPGCARSAALRRNRCRARPVNGSKARASPQAAPRRGARGRLPPGAAWATGRPSETLRSASEMSGAGGRGVERRAMRATPRHATPRTLTHPLCPHPLLAPPSIPSASPPPAPRSPPQIADECQWHPAAAIMHAPPAETPPMQPAGGMHACPLGLPCAMHTNAG